MKIKESVATLHGLNNDHSGTEDSHRLRKLGWTQIPVVDFDGTLYAILGSDVLHPGRNTAEVINISQFNDARFKAVVTEAQRKSHAKGWAWVMIGEGLALLAVYQGHLTEILNPFTAVLTYRVSPPTQRDLSETAEMLDEELQEHGLGWPQTHLS